MFSFTSIPVPTLLLPSDLRLNSSTFIKRSIQDAAPLPADVVVIQPGTHTLRIGISTQAFPLSFPHCIARKEEKNYYSNKPSVATTSLRNEFNQSLGDISIPENVIEELRSFNESVVGQQGYSDSNSTKNELILFGEAALNAPDIYSQTFPFNSLQIPQSNFYDDSIYAIWHYSLHTLLSLPSLASLSCLLVIPDTLGLDDINRLIQILYNLNFNSISLLSSSLAITFGSGLSQSCVIDFGHSVTTLAYVVNGRIVENSLLTLNVGGQDMTYVLCKALEEISVVVDVSDRQEKNMIERIREECCSCNCDLQFRDLLLEGRKKRSVRVYAELFLPPFVYLHSFDERKLTLNLCSALLQVLQSVYVPKHTIIIAGGVSAMPGWKNWIEGWAGKVDVVVGPRGVEGKELAWKGGSVVARMGSGFWIGREDIKSATEEFIIGR